MAYEEHHADQVEDTHEQGHRLQDLRIKIKSNGHGHGHGKKESSHNLGQLGSSLLQAFLLLRASLSLSELRVRPLRYLMMMMMMMEDENGNDESDHEGRRRRW